ncbi:OmpA family protein [Limnohabitans sp. Jir61]|jgi:outer membrane protein OmpA-like peptidoglycan-associated protein|uniref:OmpA family protein n=1 Tax=Limnohabitans sp. Jir61 TaxID=1826168 RepID=UPI0018EE5CB5|nr:OmpA family protein [Limnohabitans sp. Jir61]
MKKLCLVSLILSFCVFSHAADVDANNIIDALKPRPVEGQMRTRSMRNLQVEQLPPPSVSLTIQFDFDSSKVSASSASQLDQLAKALKSDDLSPLSFRVEGHTDAKGSAEYNLNLSQARADAVKKHLQRLGVTASRLETEGMGDKDPANAADKFAAENRRVRIVTLNRP